MTGWNMPPGCNVSDIPENRKIDILFDRLADGFCGDCLEEDCEDFNPEFCKHSKEFLKRLDEELNLL